MNNVFSIKRSTKSSRRSNILARRNQLADRQQERRHLQGVGRQHPHRQEQVQDRVRQVQVEILYLKD